jgi:hypothetical protein
MCVSVTKIMPNLEEQDKISGCILSDCYCFSIQRSNFEPMLCDRNYAV